jgi:hypothetical protein
MLRSRPSHETASTSNAMTPSVESSAPPATHASASTAWSGSQSQASSVESSAKANTNHGSALSGKVRGTKTVIMANTLNSASSASSTSIVVGSWDRESGACGRCGALASL